MRKNRQMILRIIFGFMAGTALLLSAGCAGEKEETLQEMELAEIPEEDTEKTDRTDAEENGSKDTKDGFLYVYVCGEVVTPGVYRLPEGARICQALEAAGGMTGQACTWYINQAEKAADGMKIYVPDREEAEHLPKEENSGESRAEETGKINLNTASKEELMTLGGIGETKAESILRYREEHGRFQSIEEIQKVEGIKAGTYEKIKDRIMVT